MKNLLLSIIGLFVLSILPSRSYSQILPDSHRIDWRNVGIPGDLPEYPVQYNIVDDFGAVGDGITDNTNAFNKAISATTAGNALYIPEGKYLIRGLNKIGKGIVIRGAGPDKTEILLEENKNFFNVWGGGPVDATTLSSEALKDSNTLDVASASGISSGDILRIARPDGVPQIVEVSEVLGSQITLAGPLYSDFPQGSNVSTLLSMVYGFGLEDMMLHSIHQPPYSQTMKVNFQYTTHSWVKNIETIGNDYIDVHILGGYKCEVRDSYFHQDYRLDEDYLSTIKYTSYGVELAGGSTDVLVENNIFLFFRHAMIMNGDQVGGNVYGYNYSSVMLENNTAGDLVRDYGIGDFEVHHRKVEMVLSEGNNFELGRIVGNDGEWRKTHNTFLRNRATQSGIGGTQVGSEDNNLIGNEAVKQLRDNPARSNTIGCSGCIDHGNYEVYNNAGISWDPSIQDHNIPNSYYLNEKPAFFGDLDWPAYGGDLMEQTNGNNTRRSPSEVRVWTIMFPEEAPSGLSASKSGTEIALTWTNNSTNEVDFIICRSVNGKNYKRIATVSETSYTDNVPVDGQYHYYVRALNYLGGENGGEAGGESDPSNIVAVGEGILSVDQSHLTNTISVFPNPANSVLHFELTDNQAQTVSIYSGLGKLISEEKYRNNSINISGLNKGMYFLVVKGMRKSYHAKFIIE